MALEGEFLDVDDFSLHENNFKIRGTVWGIADMKFDFSTRFHKNRFEA